MGLDEDFEIAAEAVKALPDNIANEDKLKLYGLFKQATVGDVNTSTLPSDDHCTADGSTDFLMLLGCRSPRIP